MSQSLSYVLLHVIFSTKDRQSFLKPRIRPDVHAYLATVARNKGCEAYRVNGVEDHVHLVIRLSRTITIANLVSALKTSSSQSIKKQWSSLSQFSWQRGYGIFSVGPTYKDALCKYIDEQEEHHRGISFQDEFRKLLRKYGVSFDEAYVWD